MLLPHMSCLSASHIQQELLGKLLIGDTDTIVGCYKLLATLRCLCGWVTTTFKDWLELKVLGQAIGDGQLGESRVVKGRQ